MYPSESYLTPMFRSKNSSTDTSLTRKMNTGNSSPSYQLTTIPQKAQKTKIKKASIN